MLKRSDKPNYEVYRPLFTGKNEKVIGLMRDKLGGKIMAEFVALKPKAYFSLMNDDSNGKKAKGKRMCNKTNT